MLIQNCHSFSVGVEKFSGVSSNSVAAPSIPTTAGRKPEKTDCTMLVCMYFKKSLLIIIIRMSEGNTKAKVATALPTTASVSPIPA